jgi:uncharacterized RDD family membrane protein YckC
MLSPHRSGCVRSAKLTVTKICSQCGAVLPATLRVCQFCNSSFSTGFSAIEEPAGTSSLGISPRDTGTRKLTTEASEPLVVPVEDVTQDGCWRGELAERLNAYRTRRKLPGNLQSQFSFEKTLADSETGLAIDEEPASCKEEFAFTIAIGKPSKTKVGEELPVEIDVSSRPDTGGQLQMQLAQGAPASQPGMYPVAQIEERRLAALIDFFCLLFAYGGFLGLFGSLGGHFTLSKLNAVVCLTTFAIVYLQYFALFTIFGGTTPGMMLRSLQVVSFSGEPPAPRQMLLRSVGYMLSAGTFFLGFLWAMWDSDELTWHDRLSRTYLSVEQTLPELEASHTAHSR